MKCGSNQLSSARRRLSAILLRKKWPNSWSKIWVKSQRPWRQTKLRTLMSEQQSLKISPTQELVTTRATMAKIDKAWPCGVNSKSKQLVLQSGEMLACCILRISSSLLGIFSSTFCSSLPVQQLQLGLLLNLLSRLQQLW